MNVDAKPDEQPRHVGALSTHDAAMRTFTKAWYLGLLLGWVSGFVPWLALS